jgi:hypothetical protein
MTSMLGRSALALGLLACAPAPSPLEARNPPLAGAWRVEFRFEDGRAHALRFEAAAGGKGTFRLLDPTSSLNPPAEPTKAEWLESRPDQVTFSGPVEFPIGNVGREAGTLVFKGAWRAGGEIAGSVRFYRQDQDVKDPATRPAKTGDFTARRDASPRS